MAAQWFSLFKFSRSLWSNSVVPVVEGTLRRSQGRESSKGRENN